MPSKSFLLAGTDDLDQPPGYPFRGPGLLVRIAPFAAIAALAEASLALTSGPAPALAVVISLVLLLAVAAAFALPWELLPGWLSVLMPLAYTGSVLALILAAGSTSGVGQRHLGAADLDSVPGRVAVTTSESTYTWGARKALFGPHLRGRKSASACHAVTVLVRRWCRPRGQPH